MTERWKVLVFRVQLQPPRIDVKHGGVILLFKTSVGLDAESSFYLVVEIAQLSTYFFSFTRKIDDCTVINQFNRGQNLVSVYKVLYKEREERLNHAIPTTKIALKQQLRCAF
ncbi:hypothetical protein CHUAL_003762 [Chamberlinius hualienensis]